MSRTVLFLCPHNAAKSVLAVAYFQRMADRLGLDLRADSAGTEPSANVSPAVVRLLVADGFAPPAARPRHVTTEELQTAFHVVSMGCAIDQLPAGRSLTRWDDLPAVSDDPVVARDAIRRRVEQLAVRLARAGT
jgi:arsenate reductase